MNTTIDGRKLSHKHLEEIRKKAISRIFEGLEKPLKVAKSYGLGSTCIYNRIKDYKKGGKKALKAKTGKKSGKKPSFTEKQEKQLVKMICKGPARCMLDFGLWTLEIVKELVYKKFGIELHTSSIQRLLIKLGLSNQKPLHKAFQQDPIKVQKRLNEEYPKIKKEAKKEKREITWGDESGFKSTDHRGKTRGKKGQTPVIKSTGARFGINAVSCVSNKGTLSRTFKG